MIHHHVCLVRPVKLVIRTGTNTVLQQKPVDSGRVADQVRSAAVVGRVRLSENAYGELQVSYDFAVDKEFVDWAVKREA